MDNKLYDFQLDGVEGVKGIRVDDSKQLGGKPASDYVTKNQDVSVKSLTINDKFKITVSENMLQILFNGKPIISWDETNGIKEI